MWQFYLSVVFIVISSKGNAESSTIDYEICDKNGIHFYEELGCKPIHDSSQPCPISYQCPEYNIPNGKCLFYGRELNNGDRANGSYCNQGFHCNALLDRKGEFQNALFIDCYFGPTTDGCYKGGELRECCQSEICPKEEVFTCELGNKTYRENETFVPEGTCYNCVCKPGFRGVYEEPYCIRRPCDMELRSSVKLEKKCAPIYLGDDQAKCCPFDFLCNDDVISIDTLLSGKQSDKKCKFGDRTFNIGDQLQVVQKTTWAPEGLNTTCSCLVPPYIGCNRKY